MPKSKKASISPALLQDRGGTLYADSQALRTYYRESDRTPYAKRCLTCGGTWKVYQQPHHSKGCGSELPAHDFVVVTKQWTATVFGIGTPVSGRKHATWFEADREIAAAPLLHGAHITEANWLGYQIDTADHLDHIDRVRAFVATLGMSTDQDIVTGEQILGIARGDETLAAELLTGYEKHGHLNCVHYARALGL